MLFQDDGKDDAVEYDVILPNEMNQLRLFILPVLLPMVVRPPVPPPAYSVLVN